MTTAFVHQLATALPPAQWQNVTAIVAVSGGADSVALLRGMQLILPNRGCRLIVGHFNHRLRTDADADEHFVRELAERLRIPCKVGRAESNLALQTGGSLESAARDARYAFLQSVANEMGARYLVTAHTADDQAETILHRIIRGTGLRGLSGMGRTRELSPHLTIVRPLLSRSRKDIEVFLAELGQSFREDASNRDSRLTRNWLRHELLPLLSVKGNTKIAEALLRLGQCANEVTSYLERTATAQLEHCFITGDDQIEIDCEALCKQDPLIIKTMLMLLWRRQGWPEQRMTFGKWEELCRIVIEDAAASPTQIILPGRIRATRANKTLTLCCA